MDGIFTELAERRAKLSHERELDDLRQRVAKLLDQAKREDLTAPQRQDILRESNLLWAKLIATPARPTAKV